MFFMHNVFEEGANVLSLREAQKQALAIGFTEKDVVDMLEFFGKAGTILNFSDKIDDNKVSIVMRPDWLLKVLAVFILCREEYQIRLKKMKREPDGSRRLVPVLQETGIMSSAVMSNLLKEEGVSEEELSFIIKICEETLIISRLLKLPSALKIPKPLMKRNKFWIVPSFYVQEERIIGDTLFQKSRREGHEQDLQFHSKDILWDEKVPKALFERFICSVVNHVSHEPSFRLESINGSVLVAHLNKKRFEVVFAEQSKYLLNVYSSDIAHIEKVSTYIKAAYTELSTAGLSSGTDISAECDFHNEVVQSPETEAAVDEKKWDCFLSHTWGPGQVEHKKVVGIARQLEAAGVKVWLDEDQMNDNIAKQMVEGIDESHVFVAFVSQNYLDATNNENSNAGKEFNYATSTGVDKVVPVVMEKQLLNTQAWNGTVAKLNLANKLYIDFSSPVKVNDNMASLVKRIFDLKAKALKE